MIFFFVIQALVYVVSLFLAPFPIITELPWGMDNFLASGMGYYRNLMAFFPPFSTVLTAFLLYLAFRLSIIVLRFFLGSRTPTNH